MVHNLLCNLVPPCYSPRLHINIYKIPAIADSNLSRTFDRKFDPAPQNYTPWRVIHLESIPLRFGFALTSKYPLPNDIEPNRFPTLRRTTRGAAVCGQAPLYTTYTSGNLPRTCPVSNLMKIRIVKGLTKDSIDSIQKGSALTTSWP
ncbi:hypothetical protein CDAR_484401 [Caerostris darwini]|uniref:Uncharacterized protein n=1 Tax=Caerostris darwini TaxID=1538125 RepID=A0AAV4TGI0_9ARAC|nr:hypothetical protein CDAR_484401 [Caerostris darwini]